VVVIDTYPLFAQGVASVLRASDDFWVQAFGGSAREFRGAEPSDVVVVGVESDVRGVWEVCDHLLAVRNSRPLRFVLLLPGRSEFEMTAAASLGAEAILPRTAAAETLREAVTAVADGRTMVAPGMSERMLTDFAGMLRRRREAVAVDLTSREAQVLELIAAGRRNSEIAVELHLSVNTVKNHVRHILDKFGAGSRTEAVAIAARYGMVLVGQAGVSPSAPRA
jgi:DNA-binding NarL/FixJ family response regulator